MNAAISNAVLFEKPMRNMIPWITGRAWFNRSSAVSIEHEKNSEIFKNPIPRKKLMITFFTWEVLELDNKDNKQEVMSNT